MLFDPKWEQRNAFSLDSLIGWLQRKPADEIYDYSSCGDCLLARYFADKGFNNKIYVNTVAFHVEDNGGKIHTLPQNFDEIARARPYTYGAALERAREFANA